MVNAIGHMHLTAEMHKRFSAVIKTIGKRGTYDQIHIMTEKKFLFIKTNRNNDSIYMNEILLSIMTNTCAMVKVKEKI